MSENNDKSNSNQKKDHDSKKILTLVILIATLMITTTGATYAYFAISATATNNITGTAATASLAFQLSNSATTTSGTPSLTAPSSTYASKPMVPQYAYNNSTKIYIDVAKLMTDEKIRFKKSLNYWRCKILINFHIDPLICPICHEEMVYYNSYYT